MSRSTPTSDPTLAAAAYREVEAALLARWPENKLDPSLRRIKAMVDLMGDPQTAYPVVHLTGTNGKTSTCRIIDSLLRGLGLRTGRFTSPHLESMAERISIDGEPLSVDAFVGAYADVTSFADIVDGRQDQPLSFFELIVAMAYAAFADAPVDAAVVEVGLGGTWDATNVADAQVSVVTPIAIDHARLLGDTVREIAGEKAGIIKPGGFAVLAEQPLDAAEVLMRRVAEVGAGVAREGVEFGVTSRQPALGGQVISIQGLAGEYPELFLPLLGAHQARNTACAIAAVEAFLGSIELDVDVLREALSNATSPGRMEVIRRSPTIVLDAAHNPAGAEATAEAVQEAFSFTPLIGVMGVMADKDIEGVLGAFEPVFAQLVCTQNSTRRAMPAEELADIAAGIFGPDRVHIRRRLDDAIDVAASLAEEGGAYGEAIGTGGVLVTGSVITAGEARALLGGPR